MAKEHFTTNVSEGKGLSEWQRERINVAQLTRKHILEPIMTAVELIRQHDRPVSAPEEAASRLKDYQFEIMDLCAVLRLLILGGYAEIRTYCTNSGGTHSDFVSSFQADTIDEEWAQALKKLKEQE